MVPAAPFDAEFGAQALPDLETMRAMFGPEELWPTRREHWEKWAFHDFQYDQTFNVARVDRGASIEEFIANSQRYQYDLLKLAIESYRANKYTKMTGFFQFMFMDAWPAITWSVVNYFRRPKLGYEALRLTCQPMLIVLQRRSSGARPVLEAGKTGWVGGALSALTVVNDLDRAFPHARAAVALEAADGTRRPLAEWHLNIPADGVVARTPAHEVLEGKTAPANQQFLAVPPGGPGRRPARRLSPGHGAVRCRRQPVKRECPGDPVCGPDAGRPGPLCRVSNAMKEVQPAEK